MTRRIAAAGLAVAFMLPVPVNAASPPAPSPVVQIPAGNDVTTGTPADTAYAGSGNATLAAALKGIYATLNGPLTVQLSVGGTAVGNSNPVPVTVPFVQAGLGNNPGQALTIQGAPTGLPIPAVEQGSAAASAGITPAVTQSGTSLVAKASAGNLYAYSATNLSTTAGFVAVVNATTTPASGASIAPLECRVLPASGLVDKSYNPGPAPAFSTGIVVLVTTSCATYTPGGAAFIEGLAR